MTAIIDSIDRRIAALEAERAEASRWLELLNKPNGTVVKFKKKFPTGPRRTYAYVGVKVAEYWYLSGPVTGQRLTDDSLVRFLRTGVKRVQVAKSWEDAS